MGYRVVPMPLARSHNKLSPAEPAGDRGWPGARFLGPRGCGSRDPASARPLHPSRAADPCVPLTAFLWTAGLSLLHF